MGSLGSCFLPEAICSVEEPSFAMTAPRSLQAKGSRTPAASVRSTAATRFSS